MRVFRPAAILLLALCACLSPAYAASGSAGAIEAGVTWQLAFGGQGLQAGYGLRLGYQASERRALLAPLPLSRLMEFQMQGGRSLTTLAGVPLEGTTYQANQSEADAAYDAGVTSKPWYARSWVYWTLGGVAASLALSTAGSGAEGKHQSCTGTCNQQCADNTVSDCGGSLNVAGQDVPSQCAPDGTCVACGASVITDQCDGGGFASRVASKSEESRESRARLDAGTGGMGDLIEVAQ